MQVNEPSGSIRKLTEASAPTLLPLYYCVSKLNNENMQSEREQRIKNAQDELEISIFHQIVASSGGALLNSLLMTPMDVIKVRLQTKVRRMEKGERPLHCYNGIIDAFINIPRREGIRTLWSGLSAGMTIDIPASAVYFTVYDNLLEYLKKKNYSDTLTAPLLAGSIAECIASSIFSPLEMIRIKMQSEKLDFPAIRKAIQTSIKQDGVLVLYRGLPPTLMHDIPFAAIFWVCYEKLKKNMLVFLDKDRTNFLISFTSGALSGTVAAFITTPFDVVKTQRQITLGKLEQRPTSAEAAEKLSTKQISVLSVLKDILSRTGVKGLFVGLGPRLLQIAPWCAIMIGTYDYAKIFLSKKRDRNQ